MPMNPTGCAGEVEVAVQLILNDYPMSDPVMQDDRDAMIKAVCGTIAETVIVHIVANNLIITPICPFTLSPHVVSTGT